MQKAAPSELLPNASKKDAGTGLFTAGQIAAALGVSAKAVRLRLQNAVCENCVVIAGQKAKAWTLEQLPGSICNELQAVAERRGFGSVAQLLADPPKEWEAPKPWHEIPQAFRDVAEKLCQALSLALSRQHGVSGSDLMELARAGYRQVFGHEIEDSKLRYIMDRATRRDNGFSQWQRPELYLDESAFHQSEKPALEVHALHTNLDDEIRQLENKAKPTADDRAYLFQAAFIHFEKLLENFKSRGEIKAIKGSLIRYLYKNVPALYSPNSSSQGASAEKPLLALRRTFNLLYAKWSSGGKTVASITDARRTNSGNFSTLDFTGDKEKIRNEAILLGGNESLAYRKLRQDGQLSPEFIEHYSFDPRHDKSYVPHKVRTDITAEVEMCAPLHRGPWHARMKGPYIPRDWSGVQPADWFSGDDVTWNNYFWYEDETGKPQISRGECLVLCDLRTGYLLDYVLIAGKYNSRHIRSLILKVHDKHGLPHAGFYFERGVWKSRFIAGASIVKESFHWRETERGLAEKGLNLDVRHATTPRAKTIEGLFHILQDIQRDQPGFVGFNERSEKMERIQKFILKVKSGREHPGNEMLEMKEWGRRIDQIMGDYNSDPQNGKLLAGKTPAEMWQEGLNCRPLTKLPDEARYLLSTHKKPVRVRQEGIVLTIGGERMLFCNDKTRDLIGQDVLAFYNIDFPELLTVSDLDRKNYFTVKRILLPAMSASLSQFREVKAQIDGHRKRAQTIYGNIPHRMVASISNDNRHAEETKELGRFHNQQEQQFKAEQSATTRKLRKIQLTAASSGLAVGQNVRNPDRVQKGLDLVLEARRNRAAQLSQTSADQSHE